jgi:hypothetical protein
VRRSTQPYPDEISRARNATASKHKTAGRTDPRSLESQRPRASPGGQCHFLFSNFCFLTYAAPIDRLAWKHSRQNTGRPCVGRKGTVVSFPHCEQVVFVSARGAPPPPPPLPPPVSARFALHALQRFGSFLNPLSAKNICSPPVKTNSAPHSEHFRTLSWNSMTRSPWTHIGRRGAGLLHHGPCRFRRPVTGRRRARIPRACGRRIGTNTQLALPDRGLIPEVRRRAASRAEINPARDAASCAVASAKALLSPGAFRRVSCRSCAS